MTLEEAKKLAYVFAHVDGGCSSCVGSACSAASELDLGFTWTPGGEKDWGNFWEDYRPDTDYGISVTSTRP